MAGGLGSQYLVSCLERLGSVFSFSWEVGYAFGKLSYVLPWALGPEHSTEESSLSLVEAGLLDWNLGGRQFCLLV